MSKYYAKYFDSEDNHIADQGLNSKSLTDAINEAKALQRVVPMDLYRFEIYKDKEELKYKDSKFYGE